MGGDVPTSRLGVTRWKLQREVERKRARIASFKRNSQWRATDDSPKCVVQRSGAKFQAKISVPALVLGSSRASANRSSSQPSIEWRPAFIRTAVVVRSRTQQRVFAVHNPQALEHQSFQLPGPEANHIVRANALARTRSVVRAQMMCCAEAVQQSTQGFSPPRTLSSASCDAGSIHSLGFAPTRWPTCLLKRVA